VNWPSRGPAVSAVFLGRRLVRAHARAFVEALVAKFAGKECQALKQKTKQIKARSPEKAQLTSDAWAVKNSWL